MDGMKSNLLKIIQGLSENEFRWTFMMCTEDDIEGKSDCIKDDGDHDGVNDVAIMTKCDNE